MPIMSPRPKTANKKNSEKKLSIADRVCSYSIGSPIEELPIDQKNPETATAAYPNSELRGSYCHVLL